VRGAGEAGAGRSREAAATRVEQGRSRNQGSLAARDAGRSATTRGAGRVSGGGTRSRAGSRRRAEQGVCPAAARTEQGGRMILGRGRNKEKELKNILKMLLVKRRFERC
jgi:hypothetical protein